MPLVHVSWNNKTNTWKVEGDERSVRTVLCISNNSLSKDTHTCLTVVHFLTWDPLTGFANIVHKINFVHTINCTNSSRTLLNGLAELEEDIAGSQLALVLEEELACYKSKRWVWLLGWLAGKYVLLADILDHFIQSLNV